MNIEEYKADTAAPEAPCAEEKTENIIPPAPEDTEFFPADGCETSDEQLDSNEETAESLSQDEKQNEAADIQENSEEPKISEEEMYYLRFFAEEDKKDEERLEKARAKSSEKEPKEEKEQAPYNPDKPRAVDARFDFIELFVFTLALVMIVTSFFFRHSIVEGPSMESTLFEGEHLIISNFLYTPDYGDIIVCQDYSTAIKTPIVKRVIALAGDRVRITSSGDIYVNEKLLMESYVFIDDKSFHYKAMELTVPDGEIFVMGDHRNESTDSRDPNVGTISEEAVLGRVLIRLFPFDRFGRVD